MRRCRGREVREDLQGKVEEVAKASEVEKAEEGTGVA